MENRSIEATGKAAQFSDLVKFIETQVKILTTQTLCCCDATVNPCSTTYYIHIGHIGAGEEECALAIVPVKVKSNKGNKIIHTYAFLNPGSTATFCTDRLMHQLNIRGKETNILLRTMGQEKTVSSHIVPGLEVSELHGNTFIPLPVAYTQKTMPVTKQNISSPSDIVKWPYLKDVRLHSIDADIDLLIGTGAPAIMEPWQVINSQGEGQYAVRTLLG